MSTSWSAATDASPLVSAHKVRFSHLFTSEPLILLLGRSVDGRTFVTRRKDNRGIVAAFQRLVIRKLARYKIAGRREPAHSPSSQ